MVKEHSTSSRDRVPLYWPLHTKCFYFRRFKSRCSISVETILEQADWSSAETLKRFYLMPTDKGEFATVILMLNALSTEQNCLVVYYRYLVTTPFCCGYSSYNVAWDTVPLLLFLFSFLPGAIVT